MSWIIAQIEKHGKVFSMLVAFAVAGWSFSQAHWVVPRERDIASLREQVKERDHIIYELKTAYNPDQTKVDELSADKEKLGNALAAYQVELQHSQDACEGSHTQNTQCQHTLEEWKTRYADLQKQLNMSTDNGNILAKIHDLETQKASIEEDIARQTPSVVQENTDNWLRQSHDLQARILDLQQRLACQPK
jgi:chromosome segregation ATPase